MIRHEAIPLAPVLSVATLCKADSMSAAVVPGAKLLACTTKGPAVPRIERPAPGSWERDCVMGSMFAWCVLFMAEAILLVRAICAAAEEGREGGLGLPKGLLLCGLMFVLEVERCCQELISGLFGRGGFSHFRFET